MFLNLVENLHPVQGLDPAADANGRTGAYVSAKDCAQVIVKFHIKQGNAATIALSIVQATSAAGAGSKALANNVPIYTNITAATNDAFVRQTDGVSFTTDASLADKQVIFQIPTAELDVANGFCYIAGVTGASNAANITECEYFLGDFRYQGYSAQAPSQIV